MTNIRNIAPWLLRRLIVNAMSPLGVVLSFVVGFFIQLILDPPITPILRFEDGYGYIPLPLFGFKSISSFLFALLLLTISGIITTRVIKSLFFLYINNPLDSAQTISEYIKFHFMLGIWGGFCMFAVFLIAGMIFTAILANSL